MGQVFDEDDYLRRLKTLENDSEPIAEEFADISRGEDPGWIQAAKIKALKAARKAMVQAIGAEFERASEAGLLPVEVGVRRGQVGRADQAPLMRIVLRFLPMQQLVDFALKTLRERSPVGSAGDKHPGLYRDSHLVFLDGQVVTDGNVGAFKAGDQINISNPMPYARKIESGHGKMQVPGHVYEDAPQIVAGRYCNQASVKFTFMPVRFGGVQAYASFSKRLRPGRKLSHKAREDWLVREPALEIKAR